MICNLYFSRYKLFNYKYVHIVKPNVLRLNEDFFSEEVETLVSLPRPAYVLPCDLTELPAKFDHNRPKL